jgi:hypothetical protein
MSSEDKNTDQENSWAVWRHHVLKELESVRKKCEMNCQATMALQVELAMIKVKAGIWGAIGAAIPTIAAILLLVFGHMMKGG